MSSFRQRGLRKWSLWEQFLSTIGHWLIYLSTFMYPVDSEEYRVLVTFARDFMCLHDKIDNERANRRVHEKG